MLALGRRVGESIDIGDNVIIVVVQIGKGKVRLGIEAPDSVLIMRSELAQKIREGRLPPRNPRVKRMA